jgi:uncharacterized protein
MKTVAILAIRLYQWCIAPLIGDTCRFVPSCSHYAVEALQKHGFFYGSWLAIKRIVRCNPWSEGGKDQVP